MNVYHAQLHLFISSLSGLPISSARWTTWRCLKTIARQQHPLAADVGTARLPQTGPDAAGMRRKAIGEDMNENCTGAVQYRRSLCGAME